MKITTQRTMLWTADFVLVAALIGLVLMIAKKQRSMPKERNRHLEQLEGMLDAVKKPKRTQDNNTDTGTRTPTIHDKNFHYEGYVPPPPPPPKREKEVKSVPDLDTLIDIVFLMASTDTKGPNTGEPGGASITIKSLPQGKNTFFYLEGDVIGIGEKTDDSTNSARADVDSTLKLHGGAVLKRVTGGGIVCEWGKKGEREEVTVGIAVGDPPTGATLVGPNGESVVKVDTSGAPRAKRPTRQRVDFGVLSRGRGGQDVIKLSKEGFEAFESNGTKILEGITFEKAKNAEGGPALKVGSIPRELQGYGLQDGDVIVKIDSTPVSSQASIANYVKRKYRSQSRFNVQVLRDGQTRNLKVDVPRNFKEQQNLRRKLGQVDVGAPPRPDQDRQDKGGLRRSGGRRNRR